MKKLTYNKIKIVFLLWTSFYTDDVDPLTSAPAGTHLTLSHGHCGGVPAGADAQRGGVSRACRWALAGAFSHWFCEQTGGLKSLPSAWQRHVERSSPWQMVPGLQSSQDLNAPSSGQSHSVSLASVNFPPKQCNSPSRQTSSKRWFEPILEHSCRDGLTPGLEKLMLFY